VTSGTWAISAPISRSTLRGFFQRRTDRHVEHDLELALVVEGQHLQYHQLHQKPALTDPAMAAKMPIHSLRRAARPVRSSSRG
jgi:hypothetical protein